MPFFFGGFFSLLVFFSGISSSSGTTGTTGEALSSSAGDLINDSGCAPEYGASDASLDAESNAAGVPLWLQAQLPQK